MTETKLSTNKELVKAITDERVFFAHVTRVSPASDHRPLTIPISVPLTVRGSQSIPGTIHADELDSDSDNSNPTHLVGMRVPFTIKSVDDETGTLICSRKRGQQMVKQQMLPALARGEMFEGTIMGFTGFGAFVEVNGLVGLLRNADYSTDHSRVSERYNAGDPINVKCKSVSNDERKRVTWETVTKYHRTTPFVCDLEAGAVVLGRIIDIKNFPQGQAVFVRLEDNKELDVMCSMPPELEIESGVGVTVRITTIKPGKDKFSPPNLRGRILRLA